MIEDVSPCSASPLVSVVVPAYNHEKYVSQCLQSIADQTYANLEIVVVNDGSRDRTGELAERFSQCEVVSSRCTVIHQPNSGIPRTLNRAVRASRGDFVAVIASDDYMAPSRIEKQAGCLIRSPDVSLVHSYVRRVDPEGRDLGSMRGHYVPAEGEVYRHFLMGTRGVCAPSIMFRRSAFEAVGGFEESLPVEDWPFFLRLARDGHRFAFIDEELTYWRWVPASAGKRTSQMWKLSLGEFEKHLRELPPDEARAVRARLTYIYFRDATFQGNYGALPEILPLMLRSATSRRTAAYQVARVLAQRAAQLAIPPRAYGRLRELRYAIQPRG